MSALQQDHFVGTSEQRFGAVPAIANKIRTLVVFIALALLRRDRVIVVFYFTAEAGRCPSPQHYAPRNNGCPPTQITAVPSANHTYTIDQYNTHTSTPVYTRQHTWCS